MVADNCHSSKQHKFVNFRLDFNSITSVFIVTRRLEKHSTLKCICFKLLRRCNIFTFSLVSLYFTTFSVCYGYLIHHAYISLAFDFWRVCFGIRYSICFWYLLFGIHCLFKKAFRQHFFGG